MFALIATIKNLFRFDSEPREVVIVKQKLRTIATGGLPRSGTLPNPTCRPSTPVSTVTVRVNDAQTERVFYVGSNSQVSSARNGSQLPPARRNPNNVVRGERFWDRQPEISGSCQTGLERLAQVRASR